MDIESYKTSMKRVLSLSGRRLQLQMTIAKSVVEFI